MGSELNFASSGNRSVLFALTLGLFALNLHRHRVAGEPRCGAGVRDAGPGAAAPAQTIVEPATAVDEGKKVEYINSKGKGKGKGSEADGAAMV